LRRILIVGAIAVLRRAQENPGKYPWLTQLLARRPFKVPLPRGNARKSTHHRRDHRNSDAALRLDAK
jgi:hypothetical protein